MTSRSVLTAMAVALGLTLGAPTADACKCMAPTITSSYANSTDVVRAQVIYGVTIGTSTWYLARSLTTYKGCLKPGAWIYIRTGSSSASCGLQLKNGVQYLINGTMDESAGLKIPVLTAGTCGFNRPVSLLTKADRKFLSTRYNCCGKQCACANGAAPVNCFADPCQVSDCPAGSCESNYCGGCNAEFYDESHNPVCQPCQSDAECAPGQSCSLDGMCLPICSSDADCNKGNWCRPTQGGMEAGSLTGVCTPYAGEGEYCGGFTPYWAQSVCAPGLICTDFPEYIADAPGKCRQACKTSADCVESQYCDGSGVCRDDGACQAQADCTAEGNAYITVKCLGYALCIADKCDYKCGSPLCPNLEGVDFGFCDMVLGFANIGGKCSAISGCSAKGFTIFKDEASCLSACGFGPPPK